MAALKRMLRLALQNETLSRMPHVPVPKPRNTEAHLAERVALNVSEAEQEADAVVHAQEEAERRTRWILFAEASAARTYCIGPAGRMRW